MKYISIRNTKFNSYDLDSVPMRWYLSLSLPSFESDADMNVYYPFTQLEPFEEFGIFPSFGVYHCTD